MIFFILGISITLNLALIVLFIIFYKSFKHDLSGSIENLEVFNDFFKN